jgi:hypothetical protein
MKAPKYEPLKMGDRKFANEYGKKCKRYDKYLAKKKRVTD